MPGLGAPLLQFVNGESDQLSMELFLDDYTDPRGPTSLQQKETDPLGKRLRDLTRLLEIDRDLHAPPPVRFNWGPMEFDAVIEKIGRKVTMFHPDGTPARVDAVGQLQGIPHAASADRGPAPRVRRQDQAPRRRGPRKPLVDRRARVRRCRTSGYASPQRNDLDDPREIAPGDWLELPPIENPNGTGRPLSGTTATSTRRPSPCASRATTSCATCCVAVSQVEVDLVLGAASRFTLHGQRLLQPQAARVRDRARRRPARCCSPSAREVEICHRLRRRQVDADGDSAASITEITTSFPEAGSPELVVSGYDHGFALTLGKNSRTWRESA